MILTSPTVVHAHPASDQARRAIEKRDALADSEFSSASWIWLPEPDLVNNAPTGAVAFTKTFATPAGKTAATALIAITVDNNFTLWVNGQPIGATSGSGSEAWQNAQVLSAALNGSTNVFSVLGVNSNPETPGVANPAGLLAAIRVVYTDGSNDTIVSDTSWLASGSIPPDFPLPADLSQFAPAGVAAKYGSGSWGTAVTVQQPQNFDAQNLTDSKWIWSTANAGASAAVGTVGFRKTVATPSDKTASSVTVLASVDNTFQLYINGQFIGAPPLDDNSLIDAVGWEHAQRITADLTAASNVFTVIATNFPAQQGSGDTGAGFIGALLLTYTDGSSSVVRTDKTWLASADVASAVAFLAVPDAQLAPAVEQGAYGIAPWGMLGVADVLSALGNNFAIGPALTSNLPSSIPLPSNPVGSPLPLPSDSPSTSDARAHYHDGAVLILPFIWAAIAISLF
ncbi:hypothetical protein GGX14DRAFT_618422 [Mycena pura]|uniref:Uncharacterized protein n=1 Tax=Mycena pura TaxID=153505 RepID=A0AAD6VMR9_9AGAR|nr:hypothetical protein GGX14DRAFT_618422 [Mycena pura]